MLGPDQIALHSVLIEYGSPIFGTDDNEFETLEEAIDFLERSADIKPSFLKPLSASIRLCLANTDIVFKSIQFKGKKHSVIRNLKSEKERLGKLIKV